MAPDLQASGPRNKTLGGPHCQDLAPGLTETLRGTDNLIEAFAGLLVEKADRFPNIRHIVPSAASEKRL